MTRRPLPAPTRRAIGALAATAGALVLSRPALAQGGWPAGRAIEIIVPYPPGGGIDIIARLMTKYLPQQLSGASFVVTNRAGAGGQIGNEALFAAKPDGFTLGTVATLSFITHPLERSVRWRTEDFTYLANVVDDPGAFWVRADSPLKTIADLREAMGKKPEAVSVGTAAGTASDDHLLLLAFQQATGAKALHVPYNGTALAVRDLLGGQLDVASYNDSEGLSLLREGRTRCLGQAAPARWSAMGEIPTFREQGVDVLGGSARGFVAPPGLTAEITERLVSAFRTILADPAFLSEAERLNLPLRPLLGTEYKADVAREAGNTRALYDRTPWSSAN
ncbi:Bug family tripartite tricarboxylate transporter substrate binding protein [Pararoseomonas indoligenes]|uniref:Tripartite tricarboxylate transporter substrate binding protein n=1 Tax=Roseomonas indoligenes TaxID=2820811 RepID=A0A940N0X3_9PROT|nr:tripartite tricarboxylate transporter substrate binding protein [Pararoseomonas indoligenes]MBP0494747.1 tripartite tricarboxylate transporter substrate binding protein [Pararoseomonas indoligenes]